MAKSLLSCFLSSSCYSQISSSQISSSKDIDAFYHSYSEDINQLSKSFSFSHGSVSLKWPLEAMKILKKMQVELLVLIKKSNLPISFASSEDPNWFDQYMIDTITILDSCNSLKLAVSRVHRYRMMVDVMVSKLARRNGSSEAEEFESQNYLNLSTLKDKSNSSVMVAVSVLLHSAFVSTVSIKSVGYDSVCRCSQLKPFMEIRELNERDLNIENGVGSELVEHEVVVRVMVDIQAQVMDGIDDEERFLSSLELLRISSVELKEGMEKLDAAVNDVFDVVIKGRNEMLGVLRDCDLYIE